jgi:hypothetical protein
MKGEQMKKDKIKSNLKESAGRNGKPSVVYSSARKPGGLLFY